MPEQSVGLFVRPLFDTATRFGYYYIGLAEDYAARRMSVIDLPSTLATKANIFSALETEDPIFAYLNGHGNEDVYSAQDREVVMRTCSGDEALIGRVVLLLSCSCGVRLAPDAVQKGATTVFAYVVDFTWIGSLPAENDPYSKGFYEAVNAISNTLADGGTTQEAMNLSLASWNQWIDYWMGSNDPYASQVVQWMIHDRDGQRLFGDLNARITTPGPPPIPPGLPVPIPLLTGFNIVFLSLLI